MKFARFGIGSTLAGGDDIIARYSRVGALTILVCGKLLEDKETAKMLSFEGKPVPQESGQAVLW